MAQSPIIAGGATSQACSGKRAENEVTAPKYTEGMADRPAALKYGQQDEAGRGCTGKLCRIVMPVQIRDRPAPHDLGWAS